MPGVFAPEVVADPIGVIVDLVRGQQPGLDHSMVTGIVEAVSGGRAKPRELAQALLDRPAVFADGRSPAPRAVADLLIALNKAGATEISAPVCADCGKWLRAVQRRGEHWYCGVCGPRREPCGACGQLRRVSCRDRDAAPRCSQCPPDDGRDPTPLIVELVVQADPTLSTEVIVAATMKAAPQAGQRRRLAWALQDRPDLLTGAGAETPVPTVLRLIDRLCESEARTIVRPACPGCGRVIHLHRPIGGKWLCRYCTAKSRAQPCARCGAIREAAARDEHGRPLCPNCLIVDPVNQETCIDCGRRRPVSVRTDNGPVCAVCRPVKTMTCSICGHDGPCTVSAATGRPWCLTCHKRWARCALCNRTRPIRGGTLDDPRCAECVRDEPGFWRTCQGCGQPGRLHTSRCARCAVQLRLRELLGDEHGHIRPGLRELYQALTAIERPNTIAVWLDRSGPLLRELQAGERVLSHETLDELPTGKPVEHLRSVLVAIGTLPHRDEQMIRLQRWAADLIAGRADAEERNLLHRYAVWHVIRRLRSRLGDADTTYGQTVAAKCIRKSAVTLTVMLYNVGYRARDSPAC